MSDQKSALETEAGELLDHLKDYLETRSEITRLTVLEKASEGAGAAASGFLITFLFFLFFIFTGIALAYFIGEYSSHAWIGFISVAGIYLLAGFLFAANKERWIQKPLSDKIIQNYFKDHGSEKN